MSSADLRRPSLAPGRYAVSLNFATASNTPPDLGRLGRLVREGWAAEGIQAACDVEPSPFLQTWRKDNTFRDEWWTYITAVVEVTRAVRRDRLQGVVVGAASAAGFSAWEGRVALRVERLAPGGEAASPLLRSAESRIPPAYVGWGHTPRPGEAGYRRTPGCTTSGNVLVLPLAAVGAGEQSLTAPPVTAVVTAATAETGLRAGTRYAAQLAAAGTRSGGLDLARLQRAFRLAFGPDARRPSGQGVLRLGCDGAPQPFVQTFKKARAVVDDEWRVWLLCTFVVEGRDASPQRLVDAFSAALGAQGFRIAGPLRMRTGALPGAATDILHVGTVPDDFVADDHTPAAGEGGFLPLPGCPATPPGRLPFLPPAPTDPDRPVPIAVPAPADVQQVGPRPEDRPNDRPRSQGVSLPLVAGGALLLTALAVVVRSAAPPPPPPPPRWDEEERARWGGPPGPAPWR